MNLFLIGTIIFVIIYLFLLCIRSDSLPAHGTRLGNVEVLRDAREAELVTTRSDRNVLLRERIEANCALVLSLKVQLNWLAHLDFTDCDMLATNCLVKTRGKLGAMDRMGRFRVTAGHV